MTAKSSRNSKQRRAKKELTSGKLINEERNHACFRVKNKQLQNADTQEVNYDMG